MLTFRAQAGLGEGLLCDGHLDTAQNALVFPVQLAGTSGPGLPAVPGAVCAPCAALSLTRLLIQSNTLEMFPVFWAKTTNKHKAGFGSWAVLTCPCRALRNVTAQAR